MSKNTVLTILSCSDNWLTTERLNSLFPTLHDNIGSKKIYIGDNPGIATGDQSIATDKGWSVQ